MEISQEQTDFLQALKSQGIELVGSHWSLGVICLKPGEVEAYIKDVEAFAAAVYGVSKEQILAWKAFVREPICLGTTKLGKPCQRHAHRGSEVRHPAQFVISNADCYCPSHQPS